MTKRVSPFSKPAPVSVSDFTMCRPVPPNREARVDTLAGLSLRSSASVKPNQSGVTSLSYGVSSAKFSTVVTPSVRPELAPPTSCYLLSVVLHAVAAGVDA